MRASDPPPRRRALGGGEAGRIERAFTLVGQKRGEILSAHRPAKLMRVERELFDFARGEAAIGGQGRKKSLFCIAREGDRFFLGQRLGEACAFGGGFVIEGQRGGAFGVVEFLHQLGGPAKIASFHDQKAARLAPLDPGERI